MELSQRFLALKEKVYNNEHIDLHWVQKLLEEVYKQEITHSYSVNDGHLIVTEKDIRILTNTLIVPISDKTQEHFNHSSRLLEVIGIRNGNEFLKKITLNVSDMNSLNWVKQAWGFKTMIFSGESTHNHIKNALNIACQYIPETIECCYLGWSKNHKGIFLSGSGPIGKLNNNLKITVDKNLYPLRFKTGCYTEKRCYEFITKIMLNIAAPPISFNALSFSFLSLLSSVFETKEFTPQFIFFLYGPSGVRKTSLAKVYFNLAEKYVQSVPINFTASQAAMADISTVMKDMVCLYDDIPPTSNPAEKHSIDKKLEYLIRAYGDSMGRQKMSGEKQRIEQNPQGMAAITAESNPIKSASSMARCFLVNVGQNDVSLPKLTEAQNNRDIFTTGIYYYIAYIAESFDAYVDEFMGRFTKRKEIFEQLCPDIHSRLVAMGAWLHTSFAMFLKYGKDKGFMDKNTKNNLLSKHEEILKEMLLEQDSRIKQESEVRLFLSTIRELLASNKVVLSPIKKDGKRNITDNHKGVAFAQIIGFEDENYVYLLKNSAYTAVYSFFTRQAKVFPVSEQTLVTALYNKGLIKADNNKDGTKTVRITINNQRISALRFDRKEFFDLDESYVISVK